VPSVLVERSPPSPNAIPSSSGRSPTTCARTTPPNASRSVSSETATCRRRRLVCPQRAGSSRARPPASGDRHDPCLGDRHRHRPGPTTSRLPTRQRRDAKSCCPRSLERSGRLPARAHPSRRTHLPAGDRVITLAPGPHGAWHLTAARVTAVDPEPRPIAITPTVVQLQMGSTTSTADVSPTATPSLLTAPGHDGRGRHVLDDGGGRELAYVAMSRARKASHVYTTAPRSRRSRPTLTGPG